MNIKISCACDLFLFVRVYVQYFVSNTKQIAPKSFLVHQFRAVDTKSTYQTPKFKWFDVCIQFVFSCSVKKWMNVLRDLIWVSYFVDGHFSVYEKENIKFVGNIKQRRQQLRWIFHMDSDYRCVSYYFFLQVSPIDVSTWIWCLRIWNMD